MKLACATIHFPIAASIVNADPDVEAHEPAATPAIVNYGLIQADLNVLNQQIARLPAAVDDYHGTLRVAISALRRIETRLTHLADDALREVKGK